MPAYSSPVDIGNRALDHCGGRAITSFADGSFNATKVAETYDKLREEELRANLWVFATRQAALRPIDTTTMELVPDAYNAATQYYVGDIVSYLGDFWIALQATLGNVPPTDSNGVVSASWDAYFGPLTVDVWQNPNATNTAIAPPTASYHAGEIVYLAPGNGTFSAFLSLVDDNDDDPLAAPVWDDATTFTIGQVVEGSNGTLYQSAVNLNIGNDPTITAPAAAWVSVTTYAESVYVYGSDNQIYQSLAAGNTGNNPVSSPTWWLGLGMWTGVWTTVLTPQPRASSNKWHFISCTLQPLSIVFPVGTSPVSFSASPNVYLLPNNWLMRAPDQEQLGNRVFWLGAHDPAPEDYVFQGRYVISWQTAPIILRFVGNFKNVTLMDALFCGGVAARMGWELCETLTQKPDLRTACAAAYDRAISRAQTINAIEVGPIAEVEDEYIRVRV